MKPPKSKYMLGGTGFPNKNAIRDHIRAVRATTPLGEEVTDPVVLSLLQLHPQWQHKTQDMLCIGTAMVQPVYGLPSKEIVILTRLGAHVDITWRKLLDRLQADGTLKPENPVQNYLENLEDAAREAVAHQIQAVAKPGWHVDHVFPHTFRMLLYTWLTQLHKQGHDVTSIQVLDADHNLQISRRFQDQSIEQSWQEYHQRCAVLELVTPEEHHSRPVVSVNWPLLRRVSA